MENKIHIHMHYNLEYTKEILKNDYFEEEKLFICEESIITDDKIVLEILRHPKTKTNQYGEFIDYDFEYLKKIICKDLIDYKEKTKISDEWYYVISSIYYIKCELIKDISVCIANFKESI